MGLRGHLADMGDVKPLSTRSCPVCRVAMVRSEIGWACPQCGSAIIFEAPADLRTSARAEQLPRRGL